MPSNPFAKQDKPEEEPVVATEQPPEGKEFKTSSTEVVGDKPSLAIYTYNPQDGSLHRTEFPGRTFSDAEWSVNVQQFSQFEGKLLINPNSVSVVEQR